MIKYFILLILSLQITNFGLSQGSADDSTFVDSVEADVESLAEQTTEQEDSPLLDVLEKENLNTADVGFSGTSIQMRSRLTQRLQKTSGYKTGKYLGTPLKSYQMLKLKQGKNISCGILFEKDAGELKFNDFTSGFIGYKSDGFITSVIVGDYSVETGQGLSLWKGYDVCKGPDITAGTIRESRGLTYHLSSDETGYLRGMAMSFKISNLKTMIFYSRKSLSASMDSLNQIRSIYTAGYYRTETEIAKRSKLDELLYGVNTNLKLADVYRLGITYYHSSFAKQLHLEGGNGFTGDRYSIFGVDYLLQFSRINLYGETVSYNGKYSSGLSGVSIMPAKSVKIVSLYRNYSPKYFVRYANPFGESLGGSNEEGYYFGIELSPIKLFTLSAYFDQFKFPKPSSIIYPSFGNELLIQIVSRLSTKIQILVRYKTKNSELNRRISDGYSREIEIVDNEKKQNYRFNIDYRMSPAVNLRMRVEYLILTAKLTNKYEKGLAIFQNLKLKTADWLSIDFRVSYFKTDSYDSGIGQFENDLPGVLTLPVLYGKGIRWYGLVAIKIWRALLFSIKYSNIVREDVRTIGTGLDELPSNYDDRFGLQMDLNL
jgi:hypothetical protein